MRTVCIIAPLSHWGSQAAVFPQQWGEKEIMVNGNVGKYFYSVTDFMKQPLPLCQAITSHS